VIPLNGLSSPTVKKPRNHQRGELIVIAEPSVDQRLSFGLSRSLCCYPPALAKPLSFALLMLFMNPVAANRVLDLTLICEMNIGSRTGTDPFVERRVKTRIEVTELANGSLFLIGDGELFSVYTHKTANLEFMNHSSPEKWHLRNIERTEVATVDREMIIDRFSGTISTRVFYRQKNGFIDDRGFGECKKVDKGNKRF